MLPVTWVDGWPIIGNDTDGDGIGEMVWGGRKPINGHPVTVLTTNDDFDRAVLEPYWEWNHQPKSRQMVVNGTAWLFASIRMPTHRRGQFFYRMQRHFTKSV